MIKDSSIKENNINWFLERARKKKGRPRTTLKQIHKKIPSIDKYLSIRNTQNKHKTDYFFMITLIENLRHNIVHENGYVKNKEAFIKKFLCELGRYNNGKPNKIDLDNINTFFGINKYEKLIALLELYDSNSKNNEYFDRFNFLIKILMSYALLIRNLAYNHLANKVN